VPFHVTITRVDQLPAPLSDIEREVMDWKAPGQAKVTSFHKAKDVAAFANHLGGALIIGACEGDGGKLAKWEGMAPTDAGALATEYSNSIGQKCDPVPSIDPIALPCPTNSSKVVLVINVPASLRLIGVKADVASHEAWKDENKAYVYPMRTGTTTRFLTASELPMFMTPQSRRNAILLHKIPKNARVKIKVALTRYVEYLFDSVEEERNVVIVRSTNDSVTRTSYPIDGIGSVFESSEGNRDFWYLAMTRDSQNHSE